MTEIIDLQTKIVEKRAWRSLEISKLTLRDPIARDLLGLDFHTNKLQESMMLLVSRLSGLKVSTIEQIPVSDWMKIVDRVNVLISPPRRA